MLTCPTPPCLLPHAPDLFLLSLLVTESGKLSPSHRAPTELTRLARTSSSPPSPPTFAATMPIQSHPTETLARILELGIEPRQPPVNNDTFLTAAALVCRLWCAIVQPLLRRRVRLRTQEQTLIFLAGRGPQHGTLELNLVRAEAHRDALSESQLVCQVIAACPGLRKLTMDALNFGITGALRSAQLAGEPSPLLSDSVANASEPRQALTISR